MKFILTRWKIYVDSVNIFLIIRKCDILLKNITNTLNYFIALCQTLAKSLPFFQYYKFFILYAKIPECPRDFL